MASFNKVILVGNLTRDPQVKYTPSGMAVADVGLAVNHVGLTNRPTREKKKRRLWTSHFGGGLRKSLASTWPKADKF